MKKETLHIRGDLRKLKLWHLLLKWLLRCTREGEEEEEALLPVAGHFCSTMIKSVEINAVTLSLGISIFGPQI